MPIIDTTKILCITCPKGCTLEVSKQGDTVIEIKPGCKRGHEYARREMVDPRRMVATTVRVRGGVHPLLPVYTSEPFQKGKIRELMTLLRQVEIDAPVRMDTVVLANALESGIDIIASRDMPAV